MQFYKNLIFCFCFSIESSFRIQIKFLEIVGIKLSKEKNYIKKCFVLRVQEKLDVRDFKFLNFWIEYLELKF